MSASDSIDSDRVRLLFVTVDVSMDVTVSMTFLFFGRVILFRARLFLIIFAESTTGFFFLAEVLTVTSLEFLMMRAALMALLHSSLFQSPSRFSSLS